MAMCEIGGIEEEWGPAPFDEIFEGIRLINSDLMGLKYISHYEDKEIGISDFLEIARRLSQMIPKISDESLLEIDDILYENYKYQVQEYPELKSDDLDDLAIELYNDYYKDIIDGGFYVSELDHIYIRLAENLEGKHFEWIFWDLGLSRDVKKLCLFLKIFKSCLSAKTNKAEFDIRDTAISTGVSFFLMKLNKFPTLSDKYDGKIVKFIAEKAGACLKSFESDTMNLEKPKEFIKDSLTRFKEWGYEWPSHYQYILLDIFMSANNMNKRKELLVVFLEALNKLCRGKSSINCGFGSIFESLSDNLISVARYIVEEHFEEDMRSINQEYGYNIEPYWSESPEEQKINKLADMAIIDNLHKSEVVNRDQVVPKYACVSEIKSAHPLFTALHCDAESILGQPSHKNDLDFKDIDTQEYNKSSLENSQDKATDSSTAIKKFLVYDDFMKCLHLMSILHTAFTKYELLYEDVKGKDEDRLTYHGGEYGSACTKIPYRHMLYSNLEEDKASWPFEMAITKCPFLYFKPGGYDLKEKYLMYLEGKHLDEDVREEIIKSLF